MWRRVAILSGLLLLAMGTYLYIATSLFTQDKRAYVYDLQSSLVETLSDAELNEGCGILEEVLLAHKP